MIPTDRDELDVLAGLFVLGSVEPEMAAEIAEALEENDDLRQAVGRWQQRLAPLDRLVLKAEPPAELWPAIEARLPQASTNVIQLQRRLRGWRLTAIGAAAIAAALALFITLRPPPTPDYVAVLTPLTGDASLHFVAEANRSGQLTVLAVGKPAIASDRSLELWSIAGNDPARSLGVIPHAGHYSGQLPGNPSDGLTIAISLEPLGGSPTGQATGPVLFAGKLVASN
jgi:anti-sigma-K factor RskA